VSTARTTEHNVTVQLDRRILDKAKTLAAKRNTSISALLAEEIEKLVTADDAYENARRRALARLERGFHLGGKITVRRDELHER
jgi:hypothetical protein